MNDLSEEPWPGEGSPAARRRSGVWLITFTDLVALMLAFFVMLFSMSTLDEAKWRQFAHALQPDQAPRSQSEGGAATASRNIAAARPERGRDLDYLAALLTRQLAAEPQLAGAILEHRGDRIVISLPGELLFAPGSATPNGDADAVLFALAGLLRNLPNRIEVDGHTDPSRPDPDRFASNWELSLQRALAVSTALEQAGYPRPIAVRGYGAVRFAALSPRLDGPRRYALARRVDIVIREAAGSDS